MAVRNRETQNFLVECVSTVVDFVLLTLKSIALSFIALFQTIIPPSKKSVNGQIIVVTGAGHGLGRAISLQFSKLGAILVLLDINKQKADEIAQELNEKGGSAHAYQCDVSDSESVSEVGSRIKKEVGDVNILVNNAGVLSGLSLLSLTDSQIKRTLNINTLGHFWTVRQFLPKMIEMNRGHIVAVASFAGLVGNIYMTDYCASKFAIMGFMNSLADELVRIYKSNSVHLTLVCPITIDTGLAHRPTSRFPRMVPVLNVDETAETIVDSVLRNRFLVVIPSRVKCMVWMSRILPRKAALLYQTFFDYASEPNDPVGTSNGISDYCMNGKRKKIKDCEGQ